VCLGEALIVCVMHEKMLSLSHSVPDVIYMKTKSMTTPNFYDYMSRKCVKSRVRKCSAFSILHYSQGERLKRQT